MGRKTLTSSKRRYVCKSQVETGEKVECVRRAMTDRFERVCNGDEPICPWTLLRNSTRRAPSRHDSDNDDTPQQQQQQPSMTDTCCPLQGL